MVCLILLRSQVKYTDFGLSVRQRRKQTNKKIKTKQQKCKNRKIDKWIIPSAEPVTFESSRQQMFFKIGVFKKFAIFTAKHLRWSLFNKVAGLRVISCEYCQFFKNSFFIEHLRWLLLNFPLSNYEIIFKKRQDTE